MKLQFVPIDWGLETLSQIRSLKMKPEKRKEPRLSVREQARLLFEEVFGKGSK